MENSQALPLPASGTGLACARGADAPLSPDCTVERTPTQDGVILTVRHPDGGFRRLRQALSNQYNLSMNEPNIQVWSVDVRGDRSLTLLHTQHNRRPLEANSAEEVLKHIGRLWGFDVRLESVDDHGQVSKTFECKVDKAHRELFI